MRTMFPFVSKMRQIQQKTGNRAATSHFSHDRNGNSTGVGRVHDLSDNHHRAGPVLFALLVSDILRQKMLKSVTDGLRMSIMMVAGNSVNAGIASNFSSIPFQGEHRFHPCITKGKCHFVPKRVHNSVQDRK